MSFHLINLDDPHKTLCLNKITWFGLLDQALEYGWTPMGTASPYRRLFPDDDPLDFFAGRSPCGYTGQSHSLVLFEDALNLADALEKAVEDYEPSWKRFQEWGEVSLSGVTLLAPKTLPSLGAMDCLVGFCRMGAFQIQYLD